MPPLLKRVLTALLLLGVFVAAVVWAPSWLWAALMAVVVGLAAQEWAHMSDFTPLAARVYAILLALCPLLFPVVLGEGGQQAFLVGLLLLSMAFWLVIAPLWLLGKWRAQHAFIRAATGVVLLLPTWGALQYLHARGPLVLLGILAIVWIADTAAYFSGRQFGRHKLAPAISPGKTWEGVAGAWCALALYAGGVSYWSGLDGLSLYHIAYSGTTDNGKWEKVTGSLGAGQVMRVHSGSGPESALNAADLQGADVHLFTNRDNYDVPMSLADETALYFPYFT